MHKLVPSAGVAAAAAAAALIVLAPPLGAASPAAKTSDAALIRSAMAAAPMSVAKDATVVAMGANGSMRTLRRGTNGWTCIPDSPTTPGPDAMCMDGNAMKWAEAWMGHKPPPADTVGLMYMLAGGTDASNTDPYAEKPTGRGDWIRTGPHLMVVGSPSLLAGYPAAPTPDTTKPYVMWGGTPYAHLMIPVH
ncbi:MAG: hypothetical protein JO013_16100 [Alphaproteobacteria bacterium]|nr:hypothetical protein [Alphaproteobacteria bacterium]